MVYKGWSCKTPAFMDQKCNPNANSPKQSTQIFEATRMANPAVFAISGNTHSFLDQTPEPVNNHGRRSHLHCCGTADQHPDAPSPRAKKNFGYWMMQKRKALRKRASSSGSKISKTSPTKWTMFLTSGEPEV
nr:hypothetical protein Itr_chr06CG18740 [Ipomoea trifida]